MTNNRQLALEWWRGLRKETKTKLAAKHKPNWNFVMVNSSSSTIEFIFNIEKQI